MDTTRHTLVTRVQAYLAQTFRSQIPADCPDREAWDEFFLMYQRVLTRFAGKIGCRPDEMDDLVQEVWTDIIRLLPTFVYDPARGGFRRWLFRIIRSKAADCARRRARPLPAGQGELAPDDPEAEVHRKFLAEVVQLAIERYRTEAHAADWQIFELCKLQEKNSHEAAVVLAITPEAARKRLQRSLERFRDLLTSLIGVDADENL